jgi:hypothetical protein
MYGITAFEKSMKVFDFSKESLVLVPFWQPHDCKAGLSTPHLKLRTLTCSVWFKDTSCGVRHPASFLECYVLAVKRDRVDEVVVRVGKREAQVVSLR